MGNTFPIDLLHVLYLLSSTDPARDGFSIQRDSNLDCAMLFLDQSCVSFQLPDQEFKLVYVVVYNNITTRSCDRSTALVACFEPNVFVS